MPAVSITSLTAIGNPASTPNRLRGRSHEQYQRASDRSKGVHIALALLDRIQKRMRDCLAVDLARGDQAHQLCGG